MHAALHGLLGKIIARLLRLLARLGHDIDDEGEMVLAGSFTADRQRAAA